MYDMVPLGTLATIKGGSGFPEIYQGNADGEYPFIKVSDMNLAENKREICVANNYVSSNLVKSLRLQLFPRNTIVFAKVGAAVYLNKRRILSKETIIDNNMMGVVPLEVDSGFLYQFMLEVDFSDLVQPGALPSINQEIVSLIPVPSISKPQQQKIAHILTTVDNLIEKTQALIDKYTAVKQGMMHDIFTRGIDLATGQLRPRYDEAPHLYKETELGWVPKEWAIKKLGDICLENNGRVQTGPFGSQLHAEDYKESGVPIITVEHLAENRINHINLPLVGEDDFNRLSKYKIIEGDLVFSRVGSIDRCAYVTEREDGWLFSGRCLRVRIKGKTANSKYYSFQLNNWNSKKWILNHSVGSTMACLNTQILSSVPLLQPKIEEQDKISERLISVERILDELGAEMDGHKKIKKGLMQDLLTGRVRVN